MQLATVEKFILRRFALFTKQGGIGIKNKIALGLALLIAFIMIEGCTSDKPDATKGTNKAEGIGQITGIVVNADTGDIIKQDMSLFRLSDKKETDADRKRISDAFQKIQFSRDKDGKFVFSNVISGSYSLILSLRGASILSESFSVVPGKTTDLKSIKVSIKDKKFLSLQ